MNYNLIRVETQDIPKDKQIREVVHTGKYIDCFGKFQSKSGFSFANNNKYSYTHFFIEEAEEEVSVCGECETELGPDKFVGDEGWSVCEECGAVESSKNVLKPIDR